MYKLIANLGEVNDFLRLQLSVVYRNNLNKENVMRYNISGNDYLQIKLFPSLIMQYRNDSEREKFDNKKSMIMNQMDVFKFVKYGRMLESKMKEVQNLYYIEAETNLLRVNKELANKISITIPLSFNRKIWVVPIIVKDKDSGGYLEGIGMCFNVTSNYVMMQREEFLFLVDFLEQIDMNSISLQLITYAEVTKDKTFSRLDALPSAGITKQPEETKITGIGPITQEDQIPKI
jgi:hypothetical protein